MNPIVIKLGGAAGVSVAPVLADVARWRAQGLAGRPGARHLGRGRRAGGPGRARRCRHITSPSGHVSRYTDPEMLELYVMAAAGGR